jgi:exodeoxyribonuclease VII large subunit
LELYTQNSEPSTQNSVLTLSQLTAGISGAIEDSFPSPLWIKAEIAKLNHYPGSGHCYPSLVEKEKGTIKAEMRGTIWANDFMRINGNFIKITREPLKEGIQILFRAFVKYHPVYGLSLQIIDIDPSYTLGEMAREKMETIMKLKNEGLFERNRQLQIPLLPKRIAIISVKTSKGFSDFINILENNPWGYAFTCVLFPALLQGDKAVESITGQLQLISRVVKHFDAVAIIRGGGGDVGLNCYDNYLLAREVALCPLPVLTGIGHSTNETVIEMIAGYNKITPTDVAYFLIQQFHNFSAKVNDCREKIITLTREMVEQEKRIWGELSKRMLLQTENLVKMEKGLLEKVSGQIISVSKAMLTDHKHVVSLAESRLRYKPGLLIRENQIQLKTRWNWFAMRVSQLVSHRKQSLDTIEQKVQLLDPQHILKRGYSITYLDGKPITDIFGLNQGDTIITQLFKGNIRSEIKSKKE